jgi:ribosomal protein L11 methyltransferase
MLRPDSPLYIYEVKGELSYHRGNTPDSFIGLWNEEGFSYLFFSRAEDEYVNAECRTKGILLGSRHEMSYGDWQTGLPDEGIQAAGIHIVRPDHPNPSSRSIVLDTSVVFGDGCHPTTLACLELFERIVSSGTLESVLDLGTGTGILGLVAARSGVAEVVAVDRNILAAQTAQENVVRNGLENTMGVSLGEARHFIEMRRDLVFANLPFQVLRDVLTMRDVARHDRWIISGIDAPQAKFLQELLVESGYRIVDERQDPPWTTFLAELKDR